MPQGDGPGRCTLKVRGLDCPSEVPAVRSSLEGRPGVLALDFEPAEGLVRVTYDRERTDPGALAAAIRVGSGMHAEPRVPSAVAVAEAPVESPPRRRWVGAAGSGVALLTGSMLDWGSVAGPWARIAYGAAIAIAAFEIAPKAWASLRGRRLGIHLLVTVAVIGAVAIGEWGEAATVAFLFALSEALEALSLERAKRSVRSLLLVAPETAERIEESGATRTVEATGLRVGDRVLVRAGARVPVDGRVLVGRSSLDQRAITGESLPVARGPGEEVFAGTVNGEGALEVEATRAAWDTVAARTVALVRAAQASKPPIERSIERFAAWYTPLVFAGALAVMIGPPLARWGMGTEPGWGVWFARGLVVLVAACPCALVIGTPVAVVSALAAAARRGVLVKGGAVLEAVGGLRVLAFDKTGTLTVGAPDVVEVIAAGGGDSGGMLRVAAALGDRGGHPLGRAIARHARELLLDVPVADDYRAVPGLGAAGSVGSVEYHVGSHRYLDEEGLCGTGAFHDELEAAGRTVGTAVAVSSESGPLGYIRLSDRPRAEATGVVRDLERMGLRVVMLTGDNGPTAAAVAGEVGVADHRAGLLPSDKARIVGELGEKIGATGMVGDGVNDAPALAAARVGIAIGGASSAAAMEAADAVLMADDLTALPWLVRHSRRTLGRIRRNIALALGVKALVLTLAVFGYAGMWLAIAADVGTTLVVIANALRLLRAWGYD